jgi:type IV secretory pathway VirB4 component
MKISEGDRYKHIFVGGKPGTGKTALLSNWWKTDSLLKTAKILIDPSGFFAKEAYSMSKGLYCSIDHPIGINPMMDNWEPDDIADNIIECINQVVKLSTENVPLTVRMRSILRDAILWCLQNGRRRLDSVVDRLKVMKEHAETRQSLVDRINLLVQDKRMSAILCDAPPIDWNDIIDRKRTFILDCHGMSEDKMIFLGTLVTHGIKSYLRYSRKTDFKPIILYIDECQNFINPNFFTILKEGRKYRVSTILATQDFANIPEKLTKTILSNVGALVSFSVGANEANLLSREFPSLCAKDLQLLPKFHCAVATAGKEAIVKTAHPPFVKKVTIKPIQTTPRGFCMEWFDLVPI